jgi:ATP-binding cassette subfamily B protein
MVKLLKKLFLDLDLRMKLYLILILIGTLLGTFAEIVTVASIVPFISLLFTDNIQSYLIPFTNIKLEIYDASILFIIFVIISALIRIFIIWLTAKFSFQLGSSISIEILKYSVNQPYVFYPNKKSSEIIASVNKVSHFISGVLTPLIQGIVSFLFILALLSFLSFLNISITLSAITIFSFVYFISAYFTRLTLFKNSEIIARKENSRIKIIQEALGSIRNIIIDNKANTFTEQYANDSNLQANARIVNSVIALVPRQYIEAIGIIIVIILSLVLGNIESQSEILPILGVFGFTAARLLPHVQQIYLSITSINGNLFITSDVIDLLNLKDTVRKESNINENFHSSENHSHTQPIIEIKELSFSHRKDLSEVLSNINLKIERSTRVGFLGKTGSGKSTLMDLIMGLLKPNKGEILIDGQALNKYKIKEWFSKISHIPQKIFLLDKSIAENIAFGLEVENINMKQVEEVAKKAQLHEFIQSLPGKYLEEVGETGEKLSGGQIQRIGLARALYKNPQVIIVDEATSSLDSETESAVIETLENLKKDVTVLMISHKISNLEICDIIYRINNQKVELIGEYKDLINNHAK